MKSAETLLACCVVGLACFIGGQAVGVRDRAGHDRALRGEAAGAIDVPGVRRVGDRVEDRVEHRAPFTQALAGTYMPSLLRTRDSALTRWTDRTTRPLRVFLRDGDGIAGWTPDQLPAVRDAFDTWTRAGIPVRFTFVTDSASADVHVRFTAGFANGISGKTVWSRDADYWIVAGAIQLAIAHPGGGAVTPPQMRAIALHEVGHLLGLDHADSPDDIMAARVRARDLSDADRATVRLLYTVPAGSLK